MPCIIALFINEPYVQMLSNQWIGKNEHEQFLKLKFYTLKKLCFPLFKTYIQILHPFPFVVLSFWAFILTIDLLFPGQIIFF